MKRLLWLYPRAWRKRYLAEVAVIVEDLPADFDVAVDLLVGAGAAYASAIRANRILSSSAAYVHGVCVAILLQAIAFVSLVLISQRSASPTTIGLGPFQFASVTPQPYWGRLLSLSDAAQMAAVVSASALVLLIGLVVALTVVVTAPRLLRRSIA
jgi:hypothetical protein